MIKNEVLRYLNKYTTKYVVVADLGTDKVMYLSDAVMELCGFKQESDWQGKTYKEIGFGAEENVRLSYYEPLHEDRFTTREYYNKYHKIYSRVESKIITISSIYQKMRLSIITDITAQKLLERKIEAQNALYSCIETLFTVGTADKNSEEAYQKILSHLKTYYRADRAFFYKFKAGTYEVESFHQASSEDLKKIEIPFPTIATKQQIEQMREYSKLQLVSAQVVLDALDDDDKVRLARIYQECRIETFACVAITNEKGDIIAFMGITNPQIDQDTRTLMEILSRYICMFIEHRHSNEAKEQAITLEAFSKKELIETCVADFQDLTHAKENVVDVLDTLCHHYDADFAVVLLKQSDGTCSAAYSGGPSIPDLDLFQKQGSSTMRKWMKMFESQPRFVSSFDLAEMNTPEAKKILWEQYRIYNFVVAPIKDENGDLGGLLFVNNFKHLERSHLMIQIVANDISDYLQKISLSESSQVEPATKLLNKVATETQISKLLKNGATGALFIIDLDQFKKLNDTLGHRLGDIALVDLADTLKSVFRTSDIIGRIGGDEFMVFSPGLISSELIITKAKRILELGRQRYEKHGLTADTSVSIGVCVVDENYETYQDIYEKADKALYSSKSSGRNQYQIYNGEIIMKMTETQTDTMNELIQTYLMNYEHLPYGVGVVKNDPFSTLLAANPAYYEMLGHTKEELLENHENHVADILVDNVYDIVEAQPTDNDYDIAWDLRVRAADGNIRWIHDYAHYDSKLDLFFITLTDITDKMIAATVHLSFEAFQARNEVLAYVSKYTSECVVVNDVETDEIIYMNPAAMKLSGLQQENEWQGKTFVEIAFGSKTDIHPHYLEPLTDEFTSREYYNKRHDLYINAKHKRITIPNLNRQMRLTILKDITAQKQLESRIEMRRTLHNCIETLFTTTAANDVSDAVFYDLLKQLSKYYGSEGAFFYKFINGTHQLEKIYRITNDEIQIDNLPFPMTVSDEQVELLRAVSEMIVEQSASALQKYEDLIKKTFIQFGVDYEVKRFSCLAVNDSNGEIIAFMGVTNPRINEETKELMELLSRFICMFIEHQRDQKLNEEALALENTSKANIVAKCAMNFQSTAHAKDKIVDALDALCVHYGADFAMILAQNKNSDTYGIPYVGGESIPDLSAFQNQPAYTMDKWAETFKKHSQFVTDTDLDAPTSKMILNKQFGIYNFIVAPLKSGDGKLTGLLFVNNFKLKNRSHLLAHGVAKNISDYLEKVRIHERTRLDPETMIANKATIQNQVSQLLEKEEAGTLFIIDIDDFRKLNDSIGHHAGDQALVDLRDSLHQIFRDTDVIGRITGDTFVVFSPNLILGDVIESKAKQILTKCRHYYNKDGIAFETSASIGICIVNSRCKIFQSLYENADYALYLAKKGGKNQYHFYSDIEYANDTSVANEMRFYPNAVNALKSAIANNKFVVHYQPLYHVPTGTFTRAEALIRMQKPDGSLIYPNDFIQVAENSGLVVEITYLILEQVCHDLHKLLIAEPNTTLTSVAINLPYLQFTDPNMENRFMEILDKYGISPTQIKLEVTERSIATDMDLVLTKMTRLIDKGFEFELDDFGTDYSNLKICVSLPLDIIKLDRSLLTAAMNTEADRHFFQHILLALCESGRYTAMEGVEIKEQLDWAVSCHCEYIQGYYFSKPVSFENFANFLKTNPHKEICYE